MSSDALPAGVLDIVGDRINPATDDTLKAVAGFVLDPYDFISVAYPLDTQEIYTYKTGGSGGTVVATITVNYTDATKNTLSNVYKT